MATIDVSDYTVRKILFAGWIEPCATRTRETPPTIDPKPKWDFFKPIRDRIEHFEISTSELAHRICQLIPAQCPFARQIKLFGRTILTIPPLCKINPVYEELMMLRFRALSYLADECGEDISAYC